MTLRRFVFSIRIIILFDSSVSWLDSSAWTTAAAFGSRLIGDDGGCALRRGRGGRRREQTLIVGHAGIELCLNGLALANQTLEVERAVFNGG